MDLTACSRLPVLPSQGNEIPGSQSQKHGRIRSQDQILALNFHFILNLLTYFWVSGQGPDWPQIQLCVVKDSLEFPIFLNTVITVPSWHTAPPPLSVMSVLSADSWAIESECFLPVHRGEGSMSALETEIGYLGLSTYFYLAVRGRLSSNLRSSCSQAPRGWRCI